MTTLAERRFAALDAESRKRRLSDIESRELERAVRQIEHDNSRRERRSKKATA